MANRRIGGTIFFQVNGELYNAKGSFTINPGISKKEMVVGADGVHGFKELPQASRIEGAITDTDELDVEALFATRDATATVRLANGKTFVCEECIFSGDGESTTEEGEISIEFQGVRGRYVS